MATDKLERSYNLGNTPCCYNCAHWTGAVSDRGASRRCMLPEVQDEEPVTFCDEICDEWTEDI